MASLIEPNGKYTEFVLKTVKVSLKAHIPDSVVGKIEGERERVID